jgi:hypothetical protein
MKLEVKYEASFIGASILDLRGEILAYNKENINQ